MFSGVGYNQTCKHHAALSMRSLLEQKQLMLFCPTVRASARAELSSCNSSIPKGYTILWPQSVSECRPCKSHVALRKATNWLLRRTCPSGPAKGHGSLQGSTKRHLPASPSKGNPCTEPPRQAQNHSSQATRLVPPKRYFQHL
eukprot:TRINITY_DN97599_c0_g1_i1.p1 TRINITY_DN97599_c0_g1~~TRINITY_DN97599_c0_g1_i1.p1  ORF type:complete len:143 (-),score=15.24 TRINITY_DN97599_c0_g1_i1:306-734(-)